MCDTPITDASETWVASPSYPGYYASSLGRVKWRNRLRKLTPDKKGYLRLNIWMDNTSRRVSVSNIVAEAFHGPRPDGTVIRHKDGDNTNNRPGNLAYGSPLENEADKTEHGTKVQGEAHPAAKLTEAQVKAIRLRYIPRDPQNDLRAIARDYDLSPKTVHNIVTGKTWKGTTP